MQGIFERTLRQKLFDTERERFMKPTNAKLSEQLVDVIDLADADLEEIAMAELDQIRGTQGSCETVAVAIASSHGSCSCGSCGGWGNWGSCSSCFGFSCFSCSCGSCSSCFGFSCFSCSCGSCDGF